MKEGIEEIADKIQKHREAEITIGATNAAIARSRVFYNNEDQQIWLVNNQNNGESTIVRDFNNNPITTQLVNPTTYTNDGRAIYKNLKLGEILILYHEGKHSLTVPKGQIEIEIFNRATYTPGKEEGSYATDILMKLANDPRSYSYRTISEILNLQIEIDREKELLQKSTDIDAELLIQRIEAKEKEKLAILSKAQSFIRKYAELRYQPILDPQQETIKRSKVFDGTLIINGGPGTGKTTSLIQRIKFLISPSIEEYKTLTQSQKDKLFNQKTSWIFFSPNELLALFLRNSMKLEELTADAERVKVWPLHKNQMVRMYRLVTDSKRPFLFFNKLKGNNLFSNTSNNLSLIIDGLNNFYLRFQNDKLNKVKDIDVTFFKWKELGNSIQRFIELKGNINSIEELILLYINLNNNYKEETEDIAKVYSDQIKQVAGRIQIIVQKDTQRNQLLTALIAKWNNEAQEPDSEEGDDEAEIEQEDFDENDGMAAMDLEREIFTKLKAICRKQSILKFDRSTRLTKRDKELIELIPEVSDQNEYDSLGQAAYFKKYFERITKGIVANILREVPMVYKKYRREQLNLKSQNWNLTILEELVKKDNNSRIHSDEQALLLLFINTIILKLYRSAPNEFENISHPYIHGFKENCKPVIGIDEASDFSIIDLMAINSFSNPEISSVTLSGDIMQRMTSEGITSWDDFTKLVPNSEIKDLQISYRQSPTLLALAKAIYKESTGIDATYESYIERDEAEPKPLIFISENEDEKLEWIAHRIIEINRAYGYSIPSIAIFLPEEDHLENFATKLGDLDTLADAGILVKPCRDGQVLGDKNTVRVFSVKVIKGLEFEAVFFHNIDELQKKEMTNEQLLKYLYVGLSRATFYLGLTLSNRLSKDISFIEDSLDNSGKTWIL